MNLAISSRVAVWMMAAGGALAALPAMAAEPKIGVVEFQRLIIESPHGKAQGFDLILEQQAVLYNAGASDITPAVLSALQAHGGSAATKSAAPPVTPAKPPSK